MKPRCALPPHAYVPGQSARHPEDRFDRIRETARPGMTVAGLEQSDAWLCGWDYLDAGYYWEAHELWEPVWMALPPNSAERQFAQAAIQFANAALKLRMARPKAALRLCDLVENLLADLSSRESILGHDPRDLAACAADLRERISNKYAI
ncbi:DUF309 domain-containing protein [Cribrihabitans sp. XS_ASV171]